jgi:hypothetical protein
MVLFFSLTFVVQMFTVSMTLQRGAYKNGVYFVNRSINQ